MLDVIWAVMIMLSFLTAAITGRLSALSAAIGEGAERAVETALFPKYAKNEEIRGKITLNMAANMFGMGNAATPAGLSAMDAMQKFEKSRKPSREMIRFVVMNTAAFQVIPSSVVMLRSSYGSENTYDILVHIWFVSLGSLAIALTACRVFEILWDR